MKRSLSKKFNIIAVIFPNSLRYRNNFTRHPPFNTSFLVFDPILEENSCIRKTCTNEIFPFSRKILKSFWILKFVFQGKNPLPVYLPVHRKCSPIYYNWPSFYLSFSVFSSNLWVFSSCWFSNSNSSKKKC